MTILFSEQLETVRRFYVGDYNDLIYVIAVGYQGGNKLEGVKRQKTQNGVVYAKPPTLPN